MRRVWKFKPQGMSYRSGATETRSTAQLSAVRDKDGHDAQAQADAGHATNGVGVDLRSLEERVVVELGVVRQAQFDFRASAKSALGSAGILSGSFRCGSGLARRREASKMRW
jgi:hypothetical protein